jgi:DNA-binding NarL/FixJ family response regulator
MNNASKFSRDILRLYIGKIRLKKPSEVAQTNADKKNRASHTVLEKTEHNKEIKFTEREIQIGIFLLEKMSYRLIGERLFLSYRTIEIYVSQMRKKLACQSRSELCERLAEIPKFLEIGRKIMASGRIKP